MHLNGLLPGAEPFYFPGDDTGCLLAHGFTGAPQEVRWLGQHLAGQGYTVHGVRLAGHGTHVRDLGRTQWHDWYTSLLDGYHMLRRSCRCVFAVGLSMGASLSLLLAASEEVGGVVAMSAPYRLHPVQVRAAEFLRPLVFSVPKSNVDDLTERVARLQAERGERVTGHVTYTRRPLGAVLQLAALLDEMRRVLPQVHVPALVLHARHDELIALPNAQRIYDAIGSRDKQMVVLERGAHVITEDEDHRLVFETVSEFIHRHAHN